MAGRTVVFVLVACLCIRPAPAAAQFPARSVNPEAVEFESAALTETVVTALRAELFVAGSDPDRDFPVKVLELSPEALKEGGRVRVELKDAVLDVPNGQYVAIVRATAATHTVRSAPSQVFVLSQPGSPQDRVAQEQQERRWTKIAWIIGGAIFVIPFVAR